MDRLAMLQQTEVGHPGVNLVSIEKDWWVTVTLKALFQTDCRDSLIFKGGTSLSKGFNIIERFSEDIDLAISHSFFGIEKTGKSQLTQKQLSVGEQRIFATRVSGDVKAEDWMEITAEEKAELEKEK